MLTRLRNFSVATQAMFVAIPVVLVGGLMSWTSYNALNEANNALAGVYQERMPAMDEVDTILQLMARSRADVAKGLISSDPADLEKMATKVAQKMLEMRGLIGQLSERALPPKEAAALEALISPVEVYLAQGLEPAVEAARDGNSSYLRSTYFNGVERYYPAGRNAAVEMNELMSAGTGEVYAAANARFEQTRRNFLITILALGLLSAIGAFVLRQVIVSLRESVRVAKSVSSGNLDNTVEIVGRDESSQLLRALEEMQSALRVQQHKLADAARDMSRVKQGLDVVETNVMVADEHYNIVYLNDSITEMLTAAESDIQRDLPHFKADEVRGASIDIFHKKPEYQRGLLDKLSGQHKARLPVGGRTFDLLLNPITGENGERLGTVVEWVDMTARLAELNAEKLKAQDMRSQLEAIGKAQAVIEFEVDGTIIDANENFLNTVGYSLDEIKGQHHRMFAEPDYAESAEYAEFWAKLGRGEYDAGVYKRVGKGGKEIWIQASYNPILDLHGKPFKVVKYATDITEERLKNADFEGQLAAIGKVQAVIEFDVDGTIRHANENFLTALGYSLDEIKGRHHAMFAEPGVAESAEYKAFWKKLAAGQHDAGQYKRIAKGGREIWIQASYNPILDLNGKAFKVVKYATDVTEQVKASQAMSEAVTQTQNVVRSAKAGDLTQRIPLDGKEGAIEELCDGVNSLVDSMAGIVRKIKDASDSINTAAGEIASGNSDLSQRTEQQAASLEETASSMEELTSTVKQNAENAQQANQLVIGTSDVASKGGQVVGQVVSTMGEITESSKKIEDIISVIDGIAFQTNILALNAAVEAARAGEQGRGFAVVASEVRSLAQRSANAAKEIKELISNSVTKIENGSQLVGQAGKTMEEIVNSVKRVTDIMGEITAASSEQSAGIEQVNTTITQMDEVTQQNAALVEQANASAKSLEEQAGGLAESVAAFKLADDDQPSPPYVAKPSSAVSAGEDHDFDTHTPIPGHAKPAASAAGQWAEF